MSVPTSSVVIHVSRADARTPVLPLAQAMLVGPIDATTSQTNHRVLGDFASAFRSAFALANDPRDANLVVCAHDASDFPVAAKKVASIAASVSVPSLFYTESDDVRATPDLGGTVLRSSVLASRIRPHERVATGCVPDLSAEMPKGMLSVLDWTPEPSIGFIGHVASGPRALLYLRKGWNNYYGFTLRERVLSSLERQAAPSLRLDFVRRNVNLGPPMAGTNASAVRRRMRLEYVQSMFGNGYSLCIRGAGNWSYRFFETLSAGRIPLLIDTDSALPLEDSIDWSRHLCRIPLRHLHHAGELLFEFHRGLGQQGFEQIQKRNRALWLETLAPKQFFTQAMLQAARKSGPDT
jgi:hypothetical protein